MEEIMYIEINNWSPGETYPIDMLLTEAMADKNCYFQKFFSNDEWCKKNKICVHYEMVDMSLNFRITAPRSWVEKYCPTLLKDDRFIMHPDVENEDMYPSEEDYKAGKSIWGDAPFLEYKEENFGAFPYYNEED